MSKIVHVVRNRNTDCLPFPMIVANFIVCMLWVVYGVAIEDKFIQVRLFTARQRQSLNLMSLFLGSKYLGLHFSEHPIVALLLLSQSEYSRAIVSASDSGCVDYLNSI